jgi:hypothetical protein
MFANTGNLSFYLGIFFIVISFIGILFIYRIMKAGKIEKEKIDKLIELGKWFIVSVALVLSASIVNDGFRERDQDIKELEFFDKYTKIVTDDRSVEKTWLMCEFFSAVSSEGELKKAWTRYKKIIEPRYLAYMKNVNEIVKINAKEDPTEEDQLKILDLKQKNLQLDNINVTQTALPNLREQFKTASNLEKEAYRKLLNKDLDGAISDFSRTDEEYSGFHNAYDLQNMLKTEKPQTDEEWNRTYKKILKDYSWKMPEATKVELQRKIRNEP